MTVDATSSSWTPALLVPMVVEALPITSAVYAASGSSIYYPWNTPFSWYENYFGQLTSQLTLEQRMKPFRPNPLPGSDPFQYDAKTGGSGFTGVLVRWALPDGLTKGAQDQTDGDLSAPMTFPPIPNRWLVLRSYVVSPGATPAWAGWVVVSDGIADPATGDGANYPDADGTLQRVGTVFDLDSWLASAGAAGPLIETPLTATGYGDAVFAAAVPFSHGICSFADRLTGLSTDASFDVSYCVTGWYADPAQDPLAAADWAKAMKHLGWGGPEGALDGPAMTNALDAAASWATAHGLTFQGPNAQTAPSPTRTLCYGRTLQVGWPGASAAQPRAPESCPDLNERPMIAVGSTSADALSAILTSLAKPADPDTMAASIAAYLLGVDDLLEQADGGAQTALRLHASRFQSLAGGIRWVVRPEPGSDASDTPTTAALVDGLRALNEAQHDLDRATMELGLAQWHWYAQWSKAQQDSTLAASCVITAEVCQARSQALAEAIAPASSAVQTALTTLQPLPAGLVLDHVPLDPYTRPNDPVVMVTNVGRATAHGHDTARTENDALPCRLSGQTIAGWSSGGKTITPAGAAVPPTLTSPYLPAEVPDLATEFALFDPSTAATLAGGEVPVALATDQQTVGLPGTWPVEPVTTGFTALYGTVALPWNIASLAWRVPWSPLLLDWEASLWPVPVSAQASLAGWSAPQWTQFSMDAGPVPQPGGPFDANQMPRPMTLTGRSVLTPYAADLLFARAAAMPADIRPSDDELDSLQSAPVLSQALSGFTDALLQRDPSLALAGEAVAAPVTPPPAFHANPNAGAPFQPVRAGWMRPTALWLLDAFGQTVELVTTSGATGGNLEPWVATESGYVRGVGGEVVLLRPRLAQWARLNFDLLEADSDSPAADSGAPAVCGWLLLDWVDQAFAVYDAAGVYRGSVGIADGTWSPAPDLNPPSANGGPPLLPNANLAALVVALGQNGLAADLAAASEKATLAALASGTGPDGLLRAAAGTPLAVVRAAIGIDLPGPEFDEGDAATGTATTQNGQPEWTLQTAGVEGLAFPVLVGTDELLDDGLVAYIEPGQSTLGSPYLTPAPVSVAAGAPQTLTLILDPVRKVHAVCDAFPAKTLVLPLESQQAPTGKIELLLKFDDVVSAAARMTLPIPAIGAPTGDWTWVSYRSAGDPALPEPAYAADTFAALSSAPAIVHDGWLKLSTTVQTTTLTYVVVPAAIECGRQTPLLVSILNNATQPAIIEAVVVTIPSALTAVGGPSAVTVSVDQPNPLKLSVGPGTTDGDGNIAFPVAGLPPRLDPGAVATLRITGITAPSGPGSAPVTVSEKSAGITAPKTASCLVEWELDVTADRSLRDEGGTA